jgi:hypothetical protein
MYAIALRCIVFCLFVSSIVQAATLIPPMPWAPPTGLLSPEELAPLLQEWDRAIESNKFYDKAGVVAKVTGIIPEGRRFGGDYYLRYSNPEIIDRVINLYLKEDARKAAGQPIAPDATGEGIAEYMTALASIAESTFDPRIYATVLSPHSGLLSGDFRNFYLAVVNPKKTLGVLFESKRGPHGRITRGANAGKPGHPDYFYHDEIWGISVDDAYTLLSLMSTQSPAALRVGRTRTLSFVEKHVKHFAAPRKVSYRPEPVYFQWHDYRVRSAALDTVGFLGTSAEVKLVEEIIRDARDVDLERLRSVRKLNPYEQIREKGRRIIEQIRSRSPSESGTSP